MNSFFLPKKTCCFIILCFLFIVLSFSNLKAQNYNQLFIKTGDTLNFSETINNIKVQYLGEKENITGKNKKYIADVYKERFDYVKSLFDNGEIDNSIEATTYIESITNKIIKSNPLLDSFKIKSFISLSSVPNASSFGYSVFVFNAGLLTKLDNESQIAFVIAHELAHLYFHHVENSIASFINNLYSDEIQYQLKNIKKQEFKKRESFEKLAKGFVFEKKRHSRYHESEADSMAAIFISNTNYDLTESLNTLAILDKIDTISFDIQGALSTIFENNEYPFNKNWLKKEEGLLGGHASLERDIPLEDSLKTHPDCKTRIITLKRIIKNYPKSNLSLNNYNAEKLNKIKSYIPYRSIEYYYRNKEISHEIYLCLQAYSLNPNDEKALLGVGSGFTEMITAQKKHSLGKIIDYPAPFYRNDYNTLLQFINNLSSDEIANINYYFLKKVQPKIGDNKMYQYLLTTCKQQL